MVLHAVLCRQGNGAADSMPDSRACLQSTLLVVSSDEERLLHCPQGLSAGSGDCCCCALQGAFNTGTVRQALQGGWDRLREWPGAW